MSNNPFESPQDPVAAKPYAQPPTGPSKTAMPGAMMTIAIICIILGVLGLGMSCFGGLGLAATSAIEKFVEGLPNQDLTQKEFNRLNMGAQGAILVPAIFMIVINLFVATMLIVGSIGCLQRKTGGRRILNFALLAAIFYSILKVAYQVYNYFAITGALNDAVANYEGEAPQTALEQMVQFNNMGLIIGCVIGIVMALALMGFYIWAKLYVSKEKTVRYFESK